MRIDPSSPLPQTAVAQSIKFQGMGDYLEFFLFIYLSLLIFQRIVQNDGLYVLASLAHKVMMVLGEDLVIISMIAEFYMTH